MTTYSKFRPTGFDSEGAFLPDRQDWIVVSCAQNRDSDSLAVSNFRTAMKMLGGESDNVEVHRFGHWANGWFEIIIVRPDTPQEVIAMGIDSQLKDYPVLDESDWSNLEWERASEIENG